MKNLKHMVIRTVEMVITTNGPVYVWFVGENRKDAKLSVRQKKGKFYADFEDNEANVVHSHKFRSYKLLCEYLDLLFENVLLDNDYYTPIQRVQWDVPGFTATIVNVNVMDNNHVYETFARCIDFYFANMKV